MTPATIANNTGDKVQGSSTTQYHTPHQIATKMGGQRHNSPLRNVIDYRDKNN
jgi:hypothetical protein